MLFEFGAPTSQYAEMGADAALIIRRPQDLSPTDLDNMLEEAYEEGATIEDVEGEESLEDESEGEPGRRVIDEAELEGDPEEAFDLMGDDGLEDEGETDYTGTLFVVELAYLERPQEVYSEQALRREIQRVWRERDELAAKSKNKPGRRNSGRRKTT